LPLARFQDHPKGFTPADIIVLSYEFSNQEATFAKLQLITFPSQSAHAMNQERIFRFLHEATPNQALELFYIFADPYFDISFSSSRRLKEMYAKPSTPSVPANR
jgi:hypothetical protein